MQFWIGITEMTTENGGLWLQPGSHRMGMLPHEMQGHHLACTKLPGEGEFIAADKGDVVLFSSFMLHRTKKNNSDSDRWAYVVEYMSTDHYDPLVDPPFFVVTEDGEPRPRFVDSYEGREKLANRLKYSGVILKTKSKRLVGRLKKSVLGGAN